MDPPTKRRRSSRRESRPGLSRGQLHPSSSSADGACERREPSSPAVRAAPRRSPRRRGSTRPSEASPAREDGGLSLRLRSRGVSDGRTANAEPRAAEAAAGTARRRTTPGATTTAPKATVPAPDGATLTSNKKRKSASPHSSSSRRPTIPLSVTTRLSASRLVGTSGATVTPSPGPNPNPTATTSAFGFGTPLSNRRKPWLSSPDSARQPPRPPGVRNLYPAAEATDASALRLLGGSPSNAHGGDLDVCSSETLTAGFVLSYGKDYWDALKDLEKPTLPEDPATSAFDLSFSSQDSQSSVRSDTSARSERTPEERRIGWTQSDTLRERMQTIFSKSVRQPRESSEFLLYQPELTPKMRTILIDWVIELSEHFNFGPSTLHLAITMVDRVLASGPLGQLDRTRGGPRNFDDGLDDGLDDDSLDDSLYDRDSRDDDDDDNSRQTKCFLILRDRFQLLGATCTWMACKLLEISPPKATDIAYVSDHIYSLDQIMRMERRVCNALEFKLLLHPTPHQYLFEYLRASEDRPAQGGHPLGSLLPSHKSFLIYMANYMLELGRLPYAPATRNPSLLAAGAVYLARVTLGIRSPDRSVDAEGRWTPTLAYYTGYSKEDLEGTVLEIHAYHMAAETSTLKSVYTKYKAKKFKRVAWKPVALKEELGF